MSVLFGGRHAFTLIGLGRVVLISLLFSFAYIGRAWAGVLFALLASMAAAGLIVGAATAGFGSLWGVLFLLNAALYVLGVGLFLLAGATAAIRDASSVSAT
jgi:hypothetical protein